MDCFKRAFTAGLKYRGVKKRDIRKIGKIHMPTDIDTVKELCERFDLELIYNGKYSSSQSEPVVVGYSLVDNVSLVNFAGEGESVGHAVFCSDIQPFLNFNVFFVIRGW